MGGNSVRFPPATITMDSRFANFTGLRVFRGGIPRIAASRESHSGGKRRFPPGADGGWGPSRFPPNVITRDLRLPIYGFVGF